MGPEWPTVNWNVLIGVDNDIHSDNTAAENYPSRSATPNDGIASPYVSQLTLSNRPAHSFHTAHSREIIRPNPYSAAEAPAAAATRVSAFAANASLSGSEEPNEEGGQYFSCPVADCRKRYKFKGDLKFHAFHKHPEISNLPEIISRPKSSKTDKPYPCPMRACNCGYFWKRDLRRHVQSKHPEVRYSAELYDTEGSLSNSVLKFDDKNMCTFNVSVAAPRR
jgi:hypothetical protein